MVSGFLDFGKIWQINLPSEVTCKGYRFKFPNFHSIGCALKVIIPSFVLITERNSFFNSFFIALLNALLKNLGIASVLIFMAFVKLSFSTRLFDMAPESCLRVRVVLPTANNRGSSSTFPSPFFDRSELKQIKMKRKSKVEVKKSGSQESHTGSGIFRILKKPGEKHNTYPTRLRENVFGFQLVRR